MMTPKDFRYQTMHQFLAPQQHRLNHSQQQVDVQATVDVLKVVTRGRKTSWKRR